MECIAKRRRQKRQILKCRHCFDETNNVESRNVEFNIYLKKMTKSHNDAGLWLGVARCSVPSQTFARPSLQYCLSLHVVRTPLTLSNIVSTFGEKFVKNVGNFFWHYFWCIVIRRYVTFYTAFFSTFRFLAFRTDPTKCSISFFYYISLFWSRAE